MKTSRTPYSEIFWGANFLLAIVVVLGALMVGCNAESEVQNAGLADELIDTSAGVVEDALTCIGCEVVEVNEVVDQNTLRTSIGDIHMYGAFVLDQPSDCAGFSRDRLNELTGSSIRIESGPVDSVRNDDDHYYLYTAQGDSIEEALVRAGLALAWTQDGQHLGWFLFREAEAKSTEAGCLWKGYNAFQQGEPSEFRIPGLTYPDDE